jgi:hypothetical protein
MNIVMEIRNSFAEAKRNTAIPVCSLDSRFPAWVAIPLDQDLVISERFSNVKLWSKDILIGNDERTLLLLTSSIESSRNEFASVCAQFIDPGTGGTERMKLINNPAGWWNKWKTLLGNSVEEKATYSILGEILAYEKLISDGKNPVWSALKRSTHDLEMEDCSFEVKSTINRYETTVTINSQFQIQDTGKETSLIFCRFEPSETGISISDMVDRLVSRGIERELLNNGLEHMSLEEGCSARLEKYRLLEMRKYSINDSFPSINATSFKGDKIPEAVIQIIYKVDLISLEYENWTEFILAL